MLFEDDYEVVYVIFIVGVGGLGKIILVRYVYSDENVKQNFDMLLWVFVLYEVKVKEIMEKIVIVIGEDVGNCDVEQLRMCIRGFINGKKYIFVLDNVWDENFFLWYDLKLILM